MARATKQPKTAPTTDLRPATGAIARSGIKTDPRVKQFQRAMSDALRGGPKQGRTIFS